MPKSHEIDELLAEDDWIRRMARRLVSDPGQADDLAQDAWVTALKRPDDARSLRPWLTGVLRNLLRTTQRSTGRRERRERSVARGEALPSTAELVEEVTLRREVADNLLELEEPYRSTLYLRFFRDLSLKKIAQRMDVPVSTVHSRLQRGLALMRARLDRTHGGDRRAWALAMLPLAQPSSGLATTAIATVVMSTTFKIAASIAVAGGALGLWIQQRESQALETPALVQAPVEPVARREAPAAPLELPATSSARRAAVAATEKATPAPVATAASAGTLLVEGIVIDTSRQPIAGLEVGYFEDGASAALVTADTDAGGRFAIERPAIEHDGWELADPLWRKLGGGKFTVEDALFQTLSTGVDDNDDLVLVVEPRADFAGIVQDQDGEPIAGARVAVRVRRSLHVELGFAQFFSGDTASPEVRTDELGAFSIAKSCGGEHVFLGVYLAGYEGAEVDLPRAGDLSLRITLARIDDTIDVSGRVIDAGGAAVEGAQVSMGHTVELTDAGGEFVLHWSSSEARELSNVVRGEDGVWVKEEIPLHIAALAEGHMPAWLDLEGVDLSEPLLLRLGTGPLSISGIVVDEDGHARTGVVVWARNLTPFGKQIRRQGRNHSSLPLTVEEELRGGGQTRGVVSDASGRFVLDGLLDQEYDVQIYDPATAELGEGWSLAAGTEDVELVLKRDPSLARVSGRLVGLSGQPIADVMVSAHRSSDAMSFGQHESPPDRLLLRVTTDEDGRFEFPQLATADTTLMLFGGNIFFRTISLTDFEDTVDMEIVEPVLCQLQVELDDPELASFLRVEDADGERLDMVESFGVSVSQQSFARIEDGRSGILRVPETGRTLVLYLRGEDGLEEVTRRPLALDPARRTVVRP